MRDVWGKNLVQISFIVQILLNLTDNIQDHLSFSLFSIPFEHRSFIETWQREISLYPTKMSVKLQTLVWQEFQPRHHHRWVKRMEMKDYWRTSSTKPRDRLHFPFDGCLLNLSSEESSASRPTSGPSGSLSGKLLLWAPLLIQECLPLKSQRVFRWEKSWTVPITVTRMSMTWWRPVGLMNPKTDQHLLPLKRLLDEWLISNPNKKFTTSTQVDSVKETTTIKISLMQNYPRNCDIYDLLTK